MTEPIILIVEDDFGIRSVLEDIMCMQKLPYALAEDGQRAIDCARVAQLSLVILDVNLPLIGGIAVAHEIRRLHGDELPVMLITADGRAKEKAEQAGATCYVRKPFSLNTFLETMYMLLGDTYAVAAS